MSAADSNGDIAYRAIQDFPGYVVGSDGKVLSYWSQSGCCVFDRPPRVLRPSIVAWGYLQVRLYRNAHGYSRRVAPLVLEAFIGPRPDGMNCCHNNGVPADNRLHNLRWDTQRNNYRDAIRHGTVTRGERVGGAKLTADQVLEIRRLGASGMSRQEIAEVFRVKRVTVYAIISKQNWRHI